MEGRAYLRRAVFSNEEYKSLSFGSNQSIIDCFRLLSLCLSSIIPHRKLICKDELKMQFSQHYIASNLWKCYT